MSNYVSNGVITETLQDFIDSFALPESVQEGDLSGLSDFSKNSLCMICDLGIGNILTAYYYGLPGSFVKNLATSTCKLFRLQSPDVCEGLIHLNLVSNILMRMMSYLCFSIYLLKYFVIFYYLLVKDIYYLIFILLTTYINLFIIKQIY